MVGKPAILMHTTDGGQNWERSPPPQSCPYSSQNCVRYGIIHADCSGRSGLGWGHDTAFADARERHGHRVHAARTHSHIDQCRHPENIAPTPKQQHLRAGVASLTAGHSGVCRPVRTQRSRHIPSPIRPEPQDHPGPDPNDHVMHTFWGTGSQGLQIARYCCCVQMLGLPP